MLSIRDELKKLAPVELASHGNGAVDAPADLVTQWQQIAAGISEIAAGQRRSVEQLESFLQVVRSAAADTQRTAAESRAFLEHHRALLEKERAEYHALHQKERDEHHALLLEDRAEHDARMEAERAEWKASIDKEHADRVAALENDRARRLEENSADRAEQRALLHDFRESLREKVAAELQQFVQRASADIAATNSRVLELMSGLREEIVAQTAPELREQVDSVLRTASAGLLDQHRTTVDEVKGLVRAAESANAAREKAITDYLQSARHELEAVIEPLASAALDFREIAVGLAEHLSGVESLRASIQSNAQAIRAAVSEELLHRHDEMERLKLAAEESAKRTAEEINRLQLTVEQSVKQATEEMEQRRLAADESAKRTTDQIANAVVALDEAMRRHSAALVADQEQRNQVAAATLSEATTVLRQSQALLTEFERSAQLLREHAEREHQRNEELRAHTLDSAEAVLQKVAASIDQVQTGAREASEKLGESREKTEVLVQAAATLEGVRGAIDEVHSSAAAAHKQVELERERSERAHAGLEEMRASLLGSVTEMFTAWKSDVAAHRQQLLASMQGDIAAHREQLVAAVRAEIAAERERVAADVDKRMSEATALILAVNEKLDARRAEEAALSAAQEARMRAELEAKATEAERADDQLRATSRSMMAFLEALDDVSGLASDDPAAGKSLGRLTARAQRVLEAAGLTEIEAEGTRVDEEQHEIVQRVPATGSLAAGTVVRIVQRGFRTAERVVRRAQVVVAE